DLRNILPVPELQKALNPGAAPSFEAAAIHGVGVFETLKEISRLSLDAIRAKITEEKRAGVAGVAGLGRAQARKPAPPPAPAAVPDPAGVPAPSPAPTSPAPAVAAAETTPPGAVTPPLAVEFAEEDTDKVKVRPVRTRGSLDIGKELEKLRVITAESKMKAPTAVKDRDVDRLFRDLVTTGGEAGQEVTRRASLEVPEHLLKGLTDLRIHLGFDRDGREEILRDAVRVTLVRTRRLKKLRLQLDLELKTKE
ncbi:MAG TPA: hypothetical protein VLL75_13920, partial [Vicinamibacteria bacterium]|nr:hypothetical protein [Vicinamibacteria bacterium]